MFTPRYFRLVIPAAVALAVGAVVLVEQLQLAAQPNGASAPDVIVGDIPDVMRHGSMGDETAFSFATVSCNIGTAPLDWIPSPDPRHPVITQNLYRIRDGRIEQLGVASWLKHGFAVAPGNVCGICTDGSGNRLGVNCSDPYSAALNGSQGGLGPRSGVNAAKGEFELPFRRLPPPPVRTVLDGRLRVANADLDPGLNAGARYFLESQYVHPQDAMAGNGLNNASYREVFAAILPGGGLQLSLNPSVRTVRTKAAIQAWGAVHPDVVYRNVDVPGDGRFIVAMRHVPGGSNRGRTMIAVQNLTSHRAAQSLTVRFDDEPNNPGFHDIAYQHEPYSDEDWRVTTNGNEVEWKTATFSEDENANALRWGSMYTFWCDSESLPQDIELELFRPGADGEDDMIEVKAFDEALVDAAGTDDWAIVEDSVNLGDVPHGMPARFGVTCRYGVDRKLSAVAANNEQLKVTAAADEGSQGKAWTIKLTADEDAPEGYFESIVTLKTDNPKDEEVRVRVFGDLVKSKAP